MFAFLSRLRLTSAESTQEDAADDTSSLNRSLNLPWPVTESSARRPRAASAANTVSSSRTPYGTQLLPPPTITISRPVLRTAMNSLTGLDEHGVSQAPASSVHNGIGGVSASMGSVRPSRGPPPVQATTSRAPQWYEAEKPRRLGAPPAQTTPAAPAATTTGPTQVSYAPPAVVRLDSGAFMPELSDDEREDSSLPRYSSHENTSAEVISQVSYPHSGYATAPASVIDSTHYLPPRPSRPEIPYEYEDEGEFYASPFDSETDNFPMPPQSISTPSFFSPSKSDNTIPKSRWGLKLQLHNTQSMPSLPTSSGSSIRQPAPYSSDQRLTHPTHGAPALEYTSYQQTQVGIDTDVYNHAYNYPLAKQLSPIAEQDYFSPVVDSSSRAGSLRFARSHNESTGSRKPSPGAERLSGAGATLIRSDSSRERAETAAEKESLKTRTGSMRSASGGSVTTINGIATLSRAGSLSKGQVTGSPSDITRPSPIYASPFLTRHLNRTVSQSSSKSDTTQPQATQCAPSPSQSQTQTQTQQSRSSAVSHLLTSIPRSIPSISPPSSNVNLSNKEVIQTPTSANTTGTATGTMYTPTSTLQGSGGQTPTSPSTLTAVAPGPLGAAVIQPPPPAMTTASTPEATPQPNLGMPKIPSLPSIAPLDLRFSQIGISEAPSKRVSKAGSALRKGLAGVDRMPVIHSDQGHHDEDDEEFEFDSEGEDINEEEYDIEIEEADDDLYERGSLHADSFVTAGTNESGDHDIEQGMELTTFEQREKGSWKKPSDLAVNKPGGPSPRGSVNLNSPKSDPTIAERARSELHRVATGDSFILRRWEHVGEDQVTSSPTTFRAKGTASRWPFRPSSPSFFSSSSLTPAFWTFWLGFLFPVLWLIGGWHFTNAGELPPRVTVCEWYLWRSSWSITEFFGAACSRITRCCIGARDRRPNKLKKAARSSQDSATSQQQQQQQPNTSIGSAENGAPLSQSATQQRRRGKRRSGNASAAQKARAGQIYPSLPRWIAEKQSTDDGRMRLNDPKRSLRGISFGYPFIARTPGASQDSAGVTTASTQLPQLSFRARLSRRIFMIMGKPNRLLDMLYGVKLVEVRGRPESGRRMFDPWIQRCRYALCWALVLLAIVLCTACVWLITVNTRKMTSG